VTAGSASLPDAVTTSGHRIRPATAADLPICAAIWRDSLNDYLRRLAQPEIPDDLVSILRLYDHLQATDPATFLVAEAPATVAEARQTGTRTAESPGIDGFAVVVRRDTLSFLSMLFVRPTVQARGLGRALLAATGIDRPGGDGSADGDRTARRATATDTAQPISNGLYASLGIVPRIPLFRLVGLPTRDGAFEPLPSGVEAIAFDEVGDAPDGLGRSALAAELDALDRDAAGFSRQPDHSFQLREGRIGFLFRDRDGRAIGYGYTSEAGRVGSIAVRDSTLMGPVVGFLVRAVQPRGAFGLWVPGTAGEAIVPLLRAGFRFDGFPVLLCWDRPFADFSRYLPMSPGLL
jgi:GNAT superfamily N-acetyltransferase